MSVVVRRISIGKWENYAKTKHKHMRLASIFGMPKYNAPADAITGCLRTFDNELSVWVVDKKEEIPFALLAMATGIKQNDVGTIHYVTFDSEELSDAGILFQPSLGDAGTAIPALKKYHNDIMNIDYVCLGKLQDMIVTKIHQNKNHKKLREDLWGWIGKAIDNKLLDISLLSEEYQKAVNKRFNGRNIEFDENALIENLQI